ncbi:MAG: sigma-54-dependent Fis family transcriptional regulator [Candidatus Riflebacteria bacterium]|nr:sigma-54-dependent Fis family transcriptional regulator [Candidatus Riflebacteria bacterium]
MKILIIEDDTRQALNLQDLLINFGYKASFFTDPRKGLSAFEEEDFDLVLLDLKMPGIDGMTFLKNALLLKPETRIVILTAFGTIENAVEAMKKGAFDFLEKPVDIDKLKKTITLAYNANQLSGMAGFSAPRAENAGEQFKTTGKAMEKIQNLINRVAALTTTVLIQGETGTGKELVARAIHGISPRKNKPFIAVNCANLQGNLLESELFGHEKGAFTGAEARKLGKFELASGGTLFLDEVAEIPLELQAKLLRAIQESEIERLGGTKPVKIDVRIVSATNRDLVSMVEKDLFRKDLYYRLNVFPLVLPPLRKRIEDIPPLALKIISEIASVSGLPAPELSSEAIEWLKHQQWHGNIRELKNVLERASILDEDGLISLADLQQVAPQMNQQIIQTQKTSANFAEVSTSAENNFDFNDTLADNEKTLLCQALEKNQGNVVLAARELNIPRRTFYDKLKKLAIDPARFRTQ